MNIITQSYLEAVFFTESEELESHCFSDISDEMLESIDEDIQSLFEFVENLREELGEQFSDLSNEQIGHDLWLTRNRHGAGFWDRGIGELGDKLTEFCHSLGEVYVHVGDDGKIYCA